eukprot:62458-Hanusia_phi.AAC.1
MLDMLHILLTAWRGGGEGKRVRGREGKRLEEGGGEERRRRIAEIAAVGRNVHLPPCSFRILLSRISALAVRCAC